MKDSMTKLAKACSTQLMKPSIIRFAELYSVDFMERLNIGRFDGSLTEQELKQAWELWGIADSMVTVELINLKDLSTTMHVAAQDDETGYFDKQVVQNLTMHLSEHLEAIHELKLIADECLYVVKEYEIKSNQGEL